jgi:hypothetical protein
MYVDSNFPTGKLHYPLLVCRRLLNFIIFQTVETLKICISYCLVLNFGLILFSLSTVMLILQMHMKT